MTDADIKLAQKYLKSLQDLLTKEEVANKGLFRQYTDIVAAPSLVSPTTIVPGDAYATGFYNSSLLGATKSGILNGNFSDGFNLRDPNGTALTPMIFVNAAGAIIGSAIITTHAITTNNTNPDYLKWYGLSGTEPMLLRSGTQNGMQLAPIIGGAHHVLRNIVIDTPGASGVTMNFDTSGGSYYEDTDMSLVRSFNAGQEGIIYAGATHAGFAYHNNFTLHDCFSYNSSREGTQFEHINNLLAYKFTVIKAGQTGGAGQNGSFQFHDVNGTVRDCIYDDSPEAGTIFTHGFTLDNAYVRWRNNNPLFVGLASGTYFAGSTRLNGQSVNIKNSIIHVDSGGSLAKLIQIAETGCDWNVTNNIISSNVSGIFDDIRSGGSNALNQSGNTFATITAPVYMPTYNVYSDYTHHGLCTSATHLNLHQGFRTRG